MPGTMFTLGLAAGLTRAGHDDEWHQPGCPSTNGRTISGKPWES
jgi:hypothetical protein